tara:strand:+ start:560 stop:1186 length:627 start_codon:yes stop_codon:yes gene_type:complete
MFLILDFTKILTLAIVHSNNILRKDLKTNRNTSDILLDQISKFFIAINKDIKSVKKIYIVTGPGSFTGIRAALTFSKVLSLTIKLEIIGISKFEILNFYADKLDKNKINLIILHFKKKQFFVQSFKNGYSIDPPKLVDLDDHKFKNAGNVNYICDSKEILTYIKKDDMKEIKGKVKFIKYNLNKLPEIINNNMIGNKNPRPLYISNYF